MLSVSHAVIGATTGRFIASPWIAFFLNILIHFPLDKVRHFLPEKKERVYILAAIDTFLTISFLVLLLLFGGEHKAVMLAGALGGVSIDFILILTPLLKSKVGDWHVKRQSHTSERKNLIIDFLVLMLLLMVWWFIK